MKINGKVAVVTGASGGIGRAICDELVHRGAGYVAMVDLDDKVVEAAEEINREAGRTVAKAFQGNTTDEEFRRGVYDEICESHGQVKQGPAQQRCFPRYRFRCPGLGGRSEDGSLLQHQRRYDGRHCGGRDRQSSRKTR